jgi:hypothetical protein
MSAEAPHRQCPPVSDLQDNYYFNSIMRMRESVDHAARPDGTPWDGPIDHALRNIRDFDSSASGWTEAHITRFQAVVLEHQRTEMLFPLDYAPSADDKALKKMKEDGFFEPTKNNITNGEWDQTKLFHYFFHDLLNLLRGSRTPCPLTSPKTRNVYRRIAKDDAKMSLAQAISSSFSQATTSMDSSYYPSPMAVSAVSVDRGPRETASYMLLHHLLNYVAVVEQNTWPDYPRWGTKYPRLAVASFDISPDAERLPVMAAGNSFNCENGGAVFSWITKESGLRHKTRLPLCSVEVLRLLIP